MINPLIFTRKNAFFQKIFDGQTTFYRYSSKCYNENNTVCWCLHVKQGVNHRKTSVACVNKSIHVYA